MPRKPIKLLIISVRYGKESKGGAAKSFENILRGLKRDKNIHITTFSRTSSKFMQKFLDPLGISYYLFLLKIIKVIRKIKPQIIITQSRIAFIASLAARITKVPIISLIRDVTDICPKHIDIIDYGRACEGLRKRKVCYNCIDYWRSLRVLVGNKSREWQTSTSALISPIIYKLRYFSCYLNLKLLSNAERVVVASNIMKNILSAHVNPQKLGIINITPIVKKPIVKPHVKNKQLLFITSSYGGSHKGLDFVLRLSKFISKDYKIYIVGDKLPTNKLRTLQNNIVNIDHVRSDKLSEIYQNSKITLVPSFWTEAFGRIIIESIVNKTPVISSPNCGANTFFKSKSYLKTVPLKLNLWLNEIQKIIETENTITDNEINEIYDKFSIERSKDDFLKLIYKVLS